MQSRELNKFVLNNSESTIVKNGIVRAKEIPMEDIEHPTEVSEIWKVKLQNTPNRCYDISKSHTQYVFCSCEWNNCGNYCELQLTILKVSTKFS